MSDLETRLILRPSNALVHALRTTAAAAAERDGSLIRAQQIDELHDAGFEASHDGVKCTKCGEPTADDGDKFCSACMPECSECGELRNKVNGDGICDDCLANPPIDQSRAALDARAEAFIERMLEL